MKNALPKKKAIYPKGVMWPQVLQHVARTLFGRRWRVHVARILKVDRKTIDKWMTDGAPGWIAAHLEKVGYAKYDELGAAAKPNEAAIGRVIDATELLYSERCQYRKSRGLRPPPLTERSKQVRNPKFPRKRR